MGTRPAPSRQVTPEQLSCVHSTKRQERSKGCNGEMPSGGAPPGAHCQPPLHPKSPEGQQQPGQKLTLQAHQALPSTLPSGAAFGQLLSSARPGLASREAGGCPWGDQRQSLSCLLCSGKSLGKGLTRVHRPCPCASPTLGRRRRGLTCQAGLHVDAGVQGRVSSVCPACDPHLRGPVMSVLREPQPKL